MKCTSPQCNYSGCDECVAIVNRRGKRAIVFVLAAVAALTAIVEVFG